MVDGSATLCWQVSGVPALLIYRAGQVLATFVRLTDQFGEDFYANEVEAFLLGKTSSTSSQRIISSLEFRFRRERLFFYIKKDNVPTRRLIYLLKLKEKWTKPFFFIECNIYFVEKFF